MIKNGLFLCSIGSLIILFSLNPNAIKYDILSMTTGVFLVLLGGYFVFKGKKQSTTDGKNNVRKK